MSPKKTVFERLEDKMIELQQNVEKKLATLEESIENLKQEIPRSIGQNLMSFSDMIGGKIEDLEEALQKVGGSGGSTIDNSTVITIKNDLNELKTAIQNVQSAIQKIKIEKPSPTTPVPTSARPATTIPTKPKSATPTIAKPTPPPTKPSPTPASTPVQPKPQTPTSAAGPLAEVLNLLDSIKSKATSGITGVQLANEMEQIRDTIVKVFRWHPALYELATFARRLKKTPKGQPPDPENLNLLLEKIDEWKNRILS